MKTILVLTLDIRVVPTIVEPTIVEPIVKVKLYYSLDLNLIPNTIYIPALKRCIDAGNLIFDMAFNVYYIPLYCQLSITSAEGDFIVNNLREHLWVDDPKKLNIITSILEI